MNKNMRKMYTEEEVFKLVRKELIVEDETDVNEIIENIFYIHGSSKAYRELVGHLVWCECKDGEIFPCTVWDDGYLSFYCGTNSSYNIVKIIYI